MRLVRQKGVLSCLSRVGLDGRFFVSQTCRLLPLSVHQKRVLYQVVNTLVRASWEASVYNGTYLMEPLVHLRTCKNALVRSPLLCALTQQVWRTTRQALIFIKISRKPHLLSIPAIGLRALAILMLKTTLQVPRLLLLPTVTRHRLSSSHFLR